MGAAAIQPPLIQPRPSPVAPPLPVPAYLRSDAIVPTQVVPVAHNPDATERGVLAASDAARVQVTSRRVEEVWCPSEEQIELLWADASAHGRMMERLSGAPASGNARPSGPDALEDDIIGLLSNTRPEESVEAVFRRVPGPRFTRQLGVFRGVLTPRCDPVEFLRLLRVIAGLVPAPDKRLADALDSLDRALEHPECLQLEARRAALVRGVREAWPARGATFAEALHEIESALAAKRSLSQIDLLQTKCLVADLRCEREALPVYVPIEALATLPRLNELEAVVIAEVTGRQEHAEACDYALFVRALGRVYPS
jgi:hypothetical protein